MFTLDSEVEIEVFTVITLGGLVAQQGRRLRV